MASKLALDGGSKVVPDGSIKSWPPITQADKDAVCAVLDSGHLHGRVRGGHQQRHGGPAYEHDGSRRAPRR